MSKNGSLKYQFHKQLNGLRRFGESRHEAKIQSNSQQVAGIFSRGTYNNYKQHTTELYNYVKENYPGIKNIKDISNDVVREFLISKADDYSSSWSMSKACSAINKFFEDREDIEKFYKSNFGFEERRIEDITRSRSHEQRLQDEVYQNLLEKHSEQVLIAKASGCRRSSIQGGEYEIKPVSFFYDQDKCLRISLIEKGGRYREAKILDVYKDQVVEIVEKTGYHIQERERLNSDEFKAIYKNSTDEPLFEKYDRHIDNHSFRAEYAEARYAEIIIHKDEVKHDYKDYDRDALSELTQDLGHNRIDVCVAHYLGR